MTHTLKNVGRSMRTIKNYTFLKILLCISNFVYRKLHFSSITLHVKVALKSHILILVSAKPFPAHQKVKYECFHCTFQIVHILPVVHGILMPFWFSVADI